jgi:dTDP-4-amino-4,6-dideoxygalactose transaminase
MQFIDLNRQQAHIRADLDQRINTVLDHGKYIMGPEITELETTLAAYVGVKHAIGVSNGTDALLLALMALGVLPGDKIITSPFTFFASAEVIANCGAIPVFVDIDPKTYNIDPVALEKVLKNYNGEIKGIIPVDIFGQIADYEAISVLADEYGCFVLEDAAQSFGASHNGQKACSFGDIATTSFFPAKPLGCYGDGGMIFTNRYDLKELLCSLRVHGKGDDKYNNVRIGMNGRLDTMQAAVLLSKFSIFPKEIELRQDVTKRYAELLADTVKVPYVEPDNVSAWAQYSVCHPSRDAIIAHLKRAGIPTAIYYPQPLHLQTAFQYLGYTQGDFPVAERVSNEVFSLPMHPYLTAEEQERIAGCIRECVTRLSDVSCKGNL